MPRVTPRSIGGRDLEAGAVGVRLHSKGPQGAKPKAEAVADILATIRERPVESWHPSQPTIGASGRATIWAKHRCPTRRRPENLTRKELLHRPKPVRLGHSLFYIY